MDKSRAENGEERSCVIYLGSHRWKPWIYIKIAMQWDRNGRVRGCLDAITNYHRVSSWSKYTREARTKSCMPIGIILVIGFVVSRNIHRCGVRLPTSLVFVRDKTRTIRSPISKYETAGCFIFIFDSKIGAKFFQPKYFSSLVFDRLILHLTRILKMKIKILFFSYRVNRECWNRNEIVLIHWFLWLIRLGGIETAKPCASCRN